MAILKCKMCWSPLDIKEGQTVCECKYCGTSQTVHLFDNGRKDNLYNRANELRYKCEFDKSSGLYETIVTQFPNEAEAYWGLVLSKYGIEYVDDPRTGEKVPTCHRTLFTSIFEDADYKHALEYADDLAKPVYEEEAKEIDRIQKHIIKISQKEDPYDIFICYKETDENNSRTPDSVLAHDIYDKLVEKQYKVFFARVTLEGKLGQEYEPIIFAALRSAKVMLVVGTKREYFNAVWVKNEWSRFLSFMKDDKDKFLVPCYKDIDVYDMPEEFLPFQSQDLSKLGYIQDLTRGIDKLFGRENKQVVSNKTVKTMTVDDILVKLAAAIQSYDYTKAEWLIEEALNIKPRCAEAYFYKILIKRKLTSIKQLIASNKLIDNDEDYLKALEFADEEYKEILISYAQKIHESINESEYQKGLAYLKNKKYDEAEATFLSILGYKDAEEMAKRAKETKCEEIYKRANEAKNNKYYDVAYELYAKLGDYKDAQELANTMYCENIVAKQTKEINAAISSENKTRFDKAISELEKIKDYPKAQALIDDATHRFNSIADVKNKKRKKIKTIVILASSIAALLIAFFIILGTVIVPGNKYNQAMSLIDEGKLSEAEEILVTLNYADSKKQLKVISANREFEEGDYKQGIADIISIGGNVNITFNGDGGTLNHTTQHVTSYPFTIDCQASKKGYTFVEWRINNYQINNQKDNYSANVELISKYSTNIYQISYDLAGGRWRNENGPKTYTVEEAYNIPDPIRDGYTFLGWSGTNIIGQTKSLVIETGSTGNHDFAANWEANTYTVTYEWNDGLNTVTSDTFTYDDSYDLVTPSRIGYNFLSWKNNGTTMSQYGTWTIDHDVTLVASWSVVEYSISYNLDGGSNNSNNPSSYTYDSETIHLLEPTRKGYTFLGWIYEGHTTPTIDVVVEKHSTGNKSFIANWSKNIYIISYEAMGGSHSNTLNEYDVDTYYSLKSASKEGYTFDGWYKDANFVTRISTISSMTENLTLYAKFTANKYTVTLDANGGGLSNPITSVDVTFDYCCAELNDDVVTLVNEQLLELPVNPIREGYRFIGWYTDENCTSYFDYSSSITENITLYASWIPSTYDYYASQGSITLSAENWQGNTVTMFVDCETPSDCMLQINYNYVWDHQLIIKNLTTNTTLYSTKKNDSQSYYFVLDNTNYYFHSDVFHFGDILSFTFGVDVYSLYAGTYTADVVFANGFNKIDYSDKVSTATGVIPPYLSTRTLEMTYDDAYALPIPVKDGFVFDGWYYNEEKVATSGDHWNASASNMTLIARWKE